MRVKLNYLITGSSKWNYLVIPEGRALHANYPEEAPQDFVVRVHMVTERFIQEMLLLLIQNAN